uniref:Uncharacterized protein n=1 Tax=Arundo donax TaxID=35708 RepID=A0A0A9E3Z2_ARUDO
MHTGCTISQSVQSSFDCLPLRTHISEIRND